MNPNSSSSSSSSDSEEELFPIDYNEAHFTSREFCLYDDPLLVTGILRAVVEEDINKVKHMIESGKSVNINDNNGNTPLHIAVIRNNLEILECLLCQHDIVVNVRNFKGETPLYNAVRNGRLDSAKKLIRAGANVNLPNFEDVTPLHVSVSHPELTHLLIAHGGQIDSIDYNGDAPIHDATAEACLETVCMLLYYNADANCPGGNNLTPFMKALINENIEVQQALFEYVDDFNTATDDHMTVLALALTHNTPFVRQMIKRGADVNYADSYLDEDIQCAFSLCLRVANCDNFKLIWKNLCYNENRNSINLSLLFDHLDKDVIEKYIQIIIESGNLQPAIESFTKNGDYFLFINRFAESSLKLQQLTALTCCLLQYGYRATNYDIYEIFSNFGYCELIKILLYMNNDIRYPWLTSMIVPRLIFDIDCKLASRTQNEIYDIDKNDALQLLEYIIYPPWVNWLLLKYREDEFMTQTLVGLPKIPSLVELTRNISRQYILKHFKVTNTCQFYTIVNHLNISSVYKKILTFEKKLYKIEY